MGRTLPSTTQLAFDLIAELKPFYETLRRADQLILDRFFEDALQHRAAISNAASLLPMEVMPFVILLEERKRINHILIEIYSQLEEQDKRLTFLLPPEELGLGGF
jgi:hypothetical protein